MTDEERNLLIQIAVALDTLLCFAVPMNNGRITDVRFELREATAKLNASTSHDRT